VEYTEDVTKFMGFEPNKSSVGQIIEKENDYYFGESQENEAGVQKKMNEEINQTNKLTKQFIEMNRCSMKELENINKGPYQAGAKNSKLYLKNVHPKVFQ